MASSSSSEPQSGLHSPPPAEKIPDDEEQQGTGLSSIPMKGTILHFEIRSNKIGYQVEFGSENTGLDLKQYIENATGLPVSHQKLLFKGWPIFCFVLGINLWDSGLIRDDATLAESQVVDGAKVSTVSLICAI